MSIIRNPIFLAIIAGIVIFVSTYYVYNMTDLIQNKKKSKKKLKNSKIDLSNFDLSKFKNGLNEFIILSSIVAGILTWFIASKYLPTDELDIELDRAVIFDEPGATKNETYVNIKNKETKITKIINSDDPTRSFNLINSGVNMPKAEVKLPNVLIDYN